MSKDVDAAITAHVGGGVERDYGGFPLGQLADAPARIKVPAVVRGLT